MPDRAYFLKLIATIIIVGAAWFGSNFYENNKEAENPTIAQSSQKENFSTPAPLNATSTIKSTAAILPVAQNIFLLPIADTSLPVRKWSVSEPEFSAKSIYAIEIISGKTLLQKEPEQIRPIASLTKLMTALVVMERANLKDTITISKEAVETYGEMGNLVINENISIESLLYALLIESSNDAAVALSEKFFTKGVSALGANSQFVDFMNQRAKELGLANTHYSDPSGLNNENVSTPKDLIKLIQKVIEYPLLTQIMKTPEIEIKSADEKYKHRLTNSNKLLVKYPEIIAGKTGYIDEAGSCMILVLKSPDNQGVIFNVILGSDDRIGEMDRLIQWEKEAFVW